MIALLPPVLHLSVCLLPCPLQICEAKGRIVAVIMDLQGPEIRTSFLLDKQGGKRVTSIELKVGET